MNHTPVYSRAAGPPGYLACATCREPLRLLDGTVWASSTSGADCLGTITLDTERARETRAISVLARGMEVDRRTVDTDLAFVLGNPDTGYFLVGGTRAELREWIKQLQIHLGEPT